MIADNSFSRYKELNKAISAAEKKSAEKRNVGTNQTQLGRVRFQDIADERYDNNIEQLTGVKFNPQTMLDNANEHKKKMDEKKDALLIGEKLNPQTMLDNKKAKTTINEKRDTLFYKKWN